MPARTAIKSESLAFQVLKDLPEIAAMSDEWDALLARSACNRAFSSPQWFNASCIANPAFQPYVVVARRGRELAGVLPLVLTNGGQLATFPSYLTDYSDVIVARDDLFVVLDLLDHARTAVGGWRQLVLSHIRRDSNCARAIKMLEKGDQIESVFRELVGCYYLRLPPTYDDFLSTRTSRFRKRLKRLRNLAADSNLVVSELTTSNFPANKLPEVFLPLHLARQTSGSCFEPAAAQSFAQRILPDLFRRGSVRACALMKAEQVVAIDLYTMGDRSLGAWNGGFLAEADYCSPGKLLIEAGIKLACAVGLEEYDFMRGAENYKHSWASETRSVGSIELSFAGAHSFVHSF